jgi:hypothetical protein
MFGFRLMMRLASAALRCLQQRQVWRSPRASARTRLSVESLSERLLPSVDLAGLAHLTLPQLAAAAESAQVRFVEIPQSGTLLSHQESHALPILSVEQVSDLLGGAPGLGQFGPPSSVTSAMLELGRQEIPILVLHFGSSVTIDLVDPGGDVAGSCGGPGSSAQTPSVVFGGLDVDSVEGDKRFLMYNGVEPDKLLMPELLSLAGDANVTQPAAAARPTFSGIEPTHSAPSAGTGGPESLPFPRPATTGASLVTFIAGWSGGERIADGLAPQTDDGSASRTAERPLSDPGNPADMLLTVDTALPDARADLVHLQHADLAIVPTYLVADGPVAPVAPLRTEPSDLGLSAHVVGLDESRGGVSRAPVSTDPLFELLVSAGSGRGVEPRRLLDDAGVRPDGIESGDLPAVALTDAGLALREWLDGFLNQDRNDTKVVAAVAVEGLLVAYVYWRRSGNADRSRGKPRGLEADHDIQLSRGTGTTLMGHACDLAKPVVRNLAKIELAVAVPVAGEIMALDLLDRPAHLRTLLVGQPVHCFHAPQQAQQGERREPFG